jgi:hypothetical protein
VEPLSLPSTYFAAAGSIQFVVSNPGSPVVQSNSVTTTVVVPTVSFSIAPNYAQAGSPDTKITVSGNGFFADSVVKWNNTPLSTTYVSAKQLTAIIPASFLSGFAQASIQVSTPETPSQTLPPQPFTTFLALPMNDIVYNAADELIYASIPGSAGEQPHRYDSVENPHGKGATVSWSPLLLSNGASVAMKQASCLPASIQRTVSAFNAAPSNPPSFAPSAIH